MSEKFDVSSRLAQGRPAVENLQQYVWASHQLGYQHSELTLHGTQLRDWYGTEDGMDLAALHNDRLAIDAATRACQDALAAQDRQLSMLPAAWQGAGAEASRHFLRRHGEASAAVASAVRTAAEALGALQENLWRAVAAKVDAVVAIEDRAAAHRVEWLAAARTVTSGAGDRASASEVVSQSVTPFVDDSVRADALTALRTAVSSVADAYQRAAAEIAAEYPPTFEVPGDLGPVSCPPAARNGDGDTCCEERAPATALVGPAAAAPTVPSAWSGAPPEPPPAPPATPPLGLPHAPPPTPPLGLPTAPPPGPPEAPPVPTAPPMAPMPSPGGMGSGTPDLGGGLPGLGQQFADTLGGLLGNAGGSAPGLPDLDVPDLDDPLELDSDTDEEADTEDEDELDSDADEGADEGVDEVAGEIVDGQAEEDAPAEDPVVPGDAESQACVDAEVPAEPAPVPTPAPPPAEPLPPLPPADPPADPMSAEQTPCAIAADELPQVGNPPE